MNHRFKGSLQKLTVQPVTGVYDYLPQALYRLCKEQDITLVRYDYNESCKGKDQCNRECAGLKTTLKGYVDSGNNVECANDIFIASIRAKV